MVRTTIYFSFWFLPSFSKCFPKPSSAPFALTLCIVPTKPFLDLGCRDISWDLIASPSLWAFAISQGRDGLSFLQAFRAMRRGYANGTFRYAVMAFEKP